MTTLRQLVNKAFGWKENPDHSPIEIVSEVAIKMDPHVILREARESGSLEAVRRWLAKRDKQLKEQQSEKSS